MSENWNPFLKYLRTDELGPIRIDKRILHCWSIQLIYLQRSKSAKVTEIRMQLNARHLCISAVKSQSSEETPCWSRGSEEAPSRGPLHRGPFFCVLAMAVSNRFDRGISRKCSTVVYNFSAGPCRLKSFWPRNIKKMLDRRLQLLSWAMSSQIVLTEEYRENAPPMTRPSTACIS